MEHSTSSNISIKERRNVGITEEILEETKKSHQDLEIILAPSQIEENLDALFIGKPISQNEVVHLHPQDGTFHVYLSAFDAELVLKKGWGELFALKGKYIPPKLESVLIFAPQTKDEIAVHRKIISAALQTKQHQIQKGINVKGGKKLW